MPSISIEFKNKRGRPNMLLQATPYAPFRYTGRQASLNAIGVCAVEGCERTVRARGWCKAHYDRWRKTGNLGRSDIREWSGEAFARFMKYVDQSAGVEGCHSWTGSLTEDGYGQFRANNKTYKAARWLLGHLGGRPLYQSEMACHHCDNPTCVNPRHLYVGNAFTNMRDERNRHVPGGQYNAAKTHCPKGHEYTEENTRHHQGKRFCRECQRLLDRARRRRSVL